MKKKLILAILSLILGFSLLILASLVKVQVDEKREKFTGYKVGKDGIYYYYEGQGGLLT